MTRGFKWYPSLGSIPYQQNQNLGRVSHRYFFKIPLSNPKMLPVRTRRSGPVRWLSCQRLELLLQRTWLQFPAAMSADTQPPVTPAPGDPVLWHGLPSFPCSIYCIHRTPGHLRPLSSSFWALFHCGFPSPQPSDSHTTLRFLVLSLPHPNLSSHSSLLFWTSAFNVRVQENSQFTSSFQFL